MLPPLRVPFPLAGGFKDFRVEKCDVSSNFTVPVMLGFLLNQVLESIGAAVGKEGPVARKP
jgi:hypothetical protein